MGGALSEVRGFGGLLRFRDYDHLTLEWLIHIGGWRTAQEVAQVMETQEDRASLALLRLLWRGVVEMGPTRGARSTWRVVPHLLE